MQFNSYIFIFIFLPIFCAGYFLLNKFNYKLGKVWIAVASAVFYVYGGLGLALVLAISIFINLLCTKLIIKLKQKKLILIVGITINVLFLIYYKYLNFLITIINDTFQQDYTLRQIILPLGISFFTFSQIMYLVSIYRQEISHFDLWDYLIYILFFPKLLMGPLHEPMNFIAQINDINKKAINWDNVSYGIKCFSYGLFKKMILADTMAMAVAWGYANIDVITSMDWLVIMLCYSFEIYFDFSGYTDMAMGISMMLNITLPMNFNSPYKALSVRDFWKRWHMSLTGFFTKYIYIPLGGNRRGSVRLYVNTIIVFLISGIWHGASYTFILWGLLHGVLSVLDRISERLRVKCPKFIQWLITFGWVNVLWLLFRSESIKQWLTILQKNIIFRKFASKYRTQ